MAACFTEWTVLPHRAIEKLSPNLWNVEGTMPGGAPRRMTIAKLRDGRLLVHNAIALGDAEMAEIERLGTVAAIVVPNSFHRQDARIWRDRYPNAKVYAPKKAKAKVSKIAKVDGDYSEIPKDDSVQPVHVEGLNGAEGVIQVHSDEGTTLVFNDIVLNVPLTKGVMGWMLAPTGRPSVPRLMRMLSVKDKSAFGRHLTELGNLPNLKRVIVGHGDTIHEAPGAVLRGLAEEFGKR